MAGPLTVQQSRTVDAIPGLHTVGGGCAYEVR
jgi:hypothetical protein